MNQDIRKKIIRIKFDARSDINLEDLKEFLSVILDIYDGLVLICHEYKGNLATLYEYETIEKFIEHNRNKIKEEYKIKVSKIRYGSEFNLEFSIVSLQFVSVFGMVIDLILNLKKRQTKKLEESKKRLEESKKLEELEEFKEFETILIEEFKKTEYMKLAQTKSFNIFLYRSFININKFRRKALINEESFIVVEVDDEMPKKNYPTPAPKPGPGRGPRHGPGL